jgi:hypothetical protein
MGARSGADSEIHGYPCFNLTYVRMTQTFRAEKALGILHGQIAKVREQNRPE